MTEKQTRPAKSISKNMLVNAAMLGLFAILGTALVAYVNELTKDRAAENVRQHTLKKLHELIPPAMHDNDLGQDKIKVLDGLLGNKEEDDEADRMIIYRARKDQQPVAAIIQCIAPDGYSGKIKLLVAIQYNGRLAGVRVTEHLETPGLGDAIEAHKSDWIHIFKGKSSQNPQAEKWKVKRDSGEFDQITSATITSRAIVKATYKALQYFEQNQESIFK